MQYEKTQSYEGQILRTELNGHTSVFGALGFQHYSYIVIGDETLSNVFIENSLAAKLEESTSNVKIQVLGLKINVQPKMLFVLAAEINNTSYDKREKVVSLVDQLVMPLSKVKNLSTGLLALGIATLPLIGLGFLFLMAWLPIYITSGRSAGKTLKLVKKFKLELDNSGNKAPAANLA